MCPLRRSQGGHLSWPWLIKGIGLLQTDHVSGKTNRCESTPNFARMASKAIDGSNNRSEGRGTQKRRHKSNRKLFFVGLLRSGDVLGGYTCWCRVVPVSHGSTFVKRPLAQLSFQPKSPCRPFRHKALQFLLNFSTREVYLLALAIHLPTTFGRECLLEALLCTEACVCLLWLP